MSAAMARPALRQPTSSMKPEASKGAAKAAAPVPHSAMLSWQRSGVSLHTMRRALAVLKLLRGRRQTMML